MGSPDTALQALKSAYAEFDSFVAQGGRVSEADTRCKLIDAILKGVCEWPEARVTREEHTDSGYMDYCLTVIGRKLVVVEAKKAGTAFTMPKSAYRKLKISGTLSTDRSIKEAIEQVRGYCDDKAVRYAVATNGSAWIAFRAIREDIPWRDGSAIVFHSRDCVLENFTDFWNLFSYERVCAGSFDEVFAIPHRPKRNLYRVLDTLHNADKPLMRNRLYSYLNPLVKYVFEDIAEQDDVEVLRECYVYSQSLEVVAKDLDVVITDATPQLLRDQGTSPVVVTSRYDAGQFGTTLKESISEKKGEIFLLLGGIGSGKTTFLRRYQRAVGKATLDKHALWFHINFLATPLSPDAIEEYVWRQILSQLRERYVQNNFETRQNIKGAFADKLRMLRETALKGIEKGSEKYMEIESAHLQQWSDSPMDYTPRIVKEVSRSCAKKVVIFIDNVDQLSADQQAAVFLLAQKVSKDLNSLTVVSLREESYFTPSVQKVFTAYTNRRFHIASPRFRPVIGRRIAYALRNLQASRYPGGGGTSTDLHPCRNDLIDLLHVIQQSIFGRKGQIAQFVDSICFGNMRLALEMFSTFISSGAIDVDKILTIYRCTGTYYVPYHEWVKAIMLGSRAYYKGMQSPLANVFECGAHRNSSHFTSLRVLKYLAIYRSHNTRIGQGYVDIGETMHLFEGVFDNCADLADTLNRLTKYQLIDLDTKSTDNIAGASYMRLSSSGWYYLSILHKMFCYLDLVLQDTPVNNILVRDALRDSVQKVDNLYDKAQDTRLMRLNARFDRTEAFADYLIGEEDREFQEFGLDQGDCMFDFRFARAIRKAVDSQRAYIIGEVQRNLA